MATDLRYPIGRFEKPAQYTEADRAERIATLAALPGTIRQLVAPLSAADLERPYRTGGWTIRQVTHHLADSHVNAYVRTKFTLTTDTPRVMAYDEAVWAKLADVALPVEASVAILDGLHQRWTALLSSLPPSAFARQMNHPENGLMTLDHALAMYAWHSLHHTAHIRQALAQA